METPQAHRSRRARAIAALIAATLVISVSFGLNMPLLPPLIAALLGSADAARIALHAGLLAAVFTFALGGAAPPCGALSDRYGRRPVLLLGMIGFAATMFAFSVPRTLLALYAEQLLSGIAAAAVMPVANAVVADLAPDDHWRASRLAWLNMALVAGFILGPIAGSAPDLLLRPLPGARATLVTPFAVSGAVALVALALLWIWIPARRPAPYAAARRTSRALAPLLALTFAVSAAIGVFEVAIAIRAGSGLRLSPAHVGVLFVTCSLVMFAAQAAVSARKGDPRGTGQMIAPAFVGLALGLLAAGMAPGFASYAGAVGVFAVSGGVLVPVLAYWMSRHAGAAQGGQLGRQTAAAGLGQAAGATAAGLLFAAPQVPNSPFWTGAAVALAAAAAAFALRERLLATD